MKILLTAYDFPPRLGGIATCSFELASALARIPGVEIQVLAPKSADAENWDQAHSLAIRRVRLPRLASLAAPLLTFHIRREIRNWKPDAIINTLWHPCGLATSLATAVHTRPANPPYFVLVHGMELLESSQTLKKRVRKNLAFLKKIALGSASGVFAVSRYTAGLAKNHAGVSDSRIKICHNGVNTERFFPAPRPSELIERYDLEGRPVFLTVARLMKHKGIATVLEALPQVIQEFPKAIYLIGGEGPERKNLEERARALGVLENVRFLGRVADSQLADFYRLADCFVLASKEDLSTPNVEGFGLVILEAAACGVPAIGGRAGGIPDAIQEGQTGWLANPLDPQDVAKKMIEALRSPDEIIRRGTAARERVLREMTWGRMAERVLNHIRENVVK